LRVFLDCDVLLDVALNREPFAVSSGKLLDQLEAEQRTAAMAWHSISNIYYIAAKLSDSQVARAMIADLCGFVYVVPTSNQDVMRALELPMQDFEDALQCAAALLFQADCIVTRNLADYAGSPIRAMTPDQFIEQHLSA
jgi:predicted nucleic acid-binding protein